MINVHKRLYLLCVVLFLVFLGSAVSVKAEMEMEPVVVSATRTESSLKETSAAVEIITREEIEAKGAIRLRDILRFSAGLTFPKKDAVSIRGMNQDQTLILIDGKRFTGEVGGNFEIDRLPVNNIERIEIVRGPVSAMYGTDALGGVINIITRKPDKFSIEINPQYGFFSEDSDGDQKSVSFFASIPISERFAASLTGTWRDYGQLDNRYHESIQKDGDEQTVGLDLFFELTDSDTIIFRGDYMTEDGDDYIKNGKIKMSDDNQRQNYSLAWKHSGKRLDSELTIYTSIYEKDFEVRKNSSDKLMKFVAADRSTTVIEGHGTSILKSHRLTAGGELRRETFKGNVLHTGKHTYHGVREGIPYVGSEIDIDYYAAYLQDEWLLTDKLTLTGAIRYDDSDHFESEVSPKIGLVYRFIEHIDGGLRFKANYGQGFKTPTPADLYKQNVRHDKKMVMLPNENLGPETSHSFDLSIEGNYKKFSGKISYFQNDVEDLIDNVFTGKIDPITGYKIVRSENIKDAEIKGFEAEAEYRFLKNAGLRATYMYLDAQGDILVGPPPLRQFAEKRLEQRQRHRATFSADYTYQPWGLRLDLWGEYTGDMLLNYERDKKNNITGSNDKSYWLCYASIAKDIGEHLELYAGINNIFDKKDDEIPLYGTYIFTGIRMKF